MIKKEDIRPIYAELQGYLSQAPKDRSIGADEDERGLWEQVNPTIGELEKVTGENYSRYKIVPNVRSSRDGTYSYVDIDIYRTKLSGLISRLHGQYFSDEVAPFSGMPSTVISQTQQQSQSVHIQMLLDFQGKIDAQLQKLEPGDKKRSFLEKVKVALASVKDYAGLIALYVTTAKKCGLTLEELLELFK